MKKRLKANFFGLLLLVSFTLTLSNCVNPPSTDNNKAIVTGVYVNPSDVSVLIGAIQTFTVVVDGYNDPEQTVTWSVSGGGEGTYIDEDGNLSVAIEETADSLFVMATPVADTSISGVALVAVTTVSGVAVTPSEVSVESGGTQTFTAEIFGPNNPLQTVTWSVNGGVEGTNIDDDGILTVAIEETADTLEVKATPTADTSMSGWAYVTVIKLLRANIVRTAFATESNLSLIYDSVASGQTLHASIEYSNSLTNPVVTYLWYIDNQLQASYTAGEINLPVNELSTGIHYGLAIVTIDGTAFSQDFTFRIE